MFYKLSAKWKYGLWILATLLALPIGAYTQNDADAVMPVATQTSTNQQRYTQPGLNRNNPNDTSQQQKTDGIVYNRDDELDSLLPMKVYSFDALQRDIKIRRIVNPIFNPLEVKEYDATNRLDGRFFTSLGQAGQSHQGLYPTLPLTTPNQDVALYLRVLPDVNHMYLDAPHRHIYYQTQQPYTMLRYGSSLQKDYVLGIVHTQNIKPRWNVALNYDLAKSDGTYTNSGIKNSSLDFTTNYYSKDARYQVQGRVSRHNIEQQENGGVVNDTTCWQTRNRSGVPVNMYNATNQWRTFDIDIHQSYNTVRQFDKITPITIKLYDTIGIDTTYNVDGDDSTATVKPIIDERDSTIRTDTVFAHKPTTLNSGVWGMDLKISRKRRNFYDTQASSWYYNYGAIDSTIYYDSISHTHLCSDIYWTNDAYMSHRWQNPLTIMAGLRPEIDIINYPSGKHTLSTVNMFAKANLDFQRLTIKADAEEVVGQGRNGDYILRAMAELRTNRYTTMNIGAASEALSPIRLFYHNEGCYAWNLDGYKKTTKQHVLLNVNHTKANTATGIIRYATLSGEASRIANNTWIGSDMQPVQGNASGMMLQATLATHAKAGLFNIKLHSSIQHSSNDDVVRVPLLASKGSLYADMHLFNRVLNVMIGTDISYHTKYKADAWNPVLGTFYRQDEIEVGNYCVVDLWITLHVKQAVIYVKASHINALIESNPRYFSIPHHPIEDFGIHWGVTWKFFN